MLIDLRKDEKKLRTYLIRRVKTQSKALLADGSLPKVCAVEVGYEICQAGWLFLHFDTRHQHNHDGEWTRYVDDSNMLTRRLWHKGGATSGEVTFILPDGTEQSLYPDGQEKKYFSIIGKFIRDAMLRAKDDGLLKELPKAKKCQLDIEEFDGNWAWPTYKQLGKKNLL